MPIGLDRGDGGWGDAPGPPTSRVDATPVVWSRWRTREDERVCPECGPLDGIAWPSGEGPEPPLHNSCRCERTIAFVEFVSR